MNRYPDLLSEQECKDSLVLQSSTYFNLNSEHKTIPAICLPSVTAANISTSEYNLKEKDITLLKVSSVNSETKADMQTQQNMLQALVNEKYLQKNAALRTPVCIKNELHIQQASQKTRINILKRVTIHIQAVWLLISVFAGVIISCFASEEEVPASFGTSYDPREG